MSSAETPDDGEPPNYSLLQKLAAGIGISVFGVGVAYVYHLIDQIIRMM